LETYKEEVPPLDDMNTERYWNTLNGQTLDQKWIDGHYNYNNFNKECGLL
tara:strand:+ start:2961 stop:3110 length:150 start_codon:yes stop_codon:yes gene_type:complete